MKYFIVGLQNAFNFKGRASRKEFWWFFFIIQFLLITLQFLPIIILNGNVGDMYFLVNAILNLALLFPLLSIWVRRMHDIGKSGWWSIVPIISLVFACFKGDAGSNRFGLPSPWK